MNYSRKNSPQTTATDQNVVTVSSGKKSLIRQIFNRKMLIALIMGFACGLPLLLTMSVLQARMKEAAIDLTVIGLVNLVQVPYTWKFIWAPFLDRFIPPLLGRRRGWLAIAQIILIFSIAGLGLSDPAGHFYLMVIMALLVAFFSATQDIVVDAIVVKIFPMKNWGWGLRFISTAIVWVPW